MFISFLYIATVKKRNEPKKRKPRRHLTGTIFDGFQVVAFANSLPLRHTRRLLSYVIIVRFLFSPKADLFGAIH